MGFKTKSLPHAMSTPKSKSLQKKNKNVVSGSEINAGENVHIGDIIHQHFPEKTQTLPPKKSAYGRLRIILVTFISLSFAAYFIWWKIVGTSAPVSGTEVFPNAGGNPQKQLALRSPSAEGIGKQEEDKRDKYDVEKIASMALDDTANDAALDIISIQKKDTAKIGGSKNVKPFSVGRHEVTIAQYWAFCKKTGIPFPHKTVDTLLKDYPMHDVSWYEADAYCKYIGGRLPSIEEWMLVALKITGPDSLMPESEKLVISWNNNNSHNVPHPVGEKAILNHINVYDLFGNVEEWCSDGPMDGYKYTVGWYFKSYSVTLDLRRKPVFTRANAKSNVIGFRVVF